MMNGTQLDSIGQLLRQTREGKGIGIDHAAREMRVKPERIREMESDDISHFTHPSYARFFMRDYAQYLGLSTDQFSEYLPEAGSSISDGLDYLQYFNQVEVATRTDIIRSGRGMSSQGQAASRRAAGLGWVVFCLFAAGAIAGLFYLKDYFSPAGDDEEEVTSMAVGSESPEVVSEEANTDGDAALLEENENALNPETNFAGDRAFLLSPDDADNSAPRVALDQSAPLTLQQPTENPVSEDSPLQQPLDLQ